MINLPLGNSIYESLSGGKYWIFDKIDLKYKTVDIATVSILDVSVEDFPLFIVRYNVNSPVRYLLIDGLTGSDLWNGYRDLATSSTYFRTTVLGAVAGGPIPWNKFLSKILTYKEQHDGWSPGATQLQIDFFTTLYTVSCL